MDAAVADRTTGFTEVRALTAELASSLSAEDQVVQSMPDASPAKWHQAHTTWFFETFLLKPNLLSYREFDPIFNYLFNSYYEAVGERHPRPSRGLLTRPSLEEVSDYRSHVDEGMVRLLACDLDVASASLVDLGLHHEQQHQELLLMDIKHLFAQNPLRPRTRSSPSLCARAFARLGGPITTAGSKRSATPGPRSPSTTNRPVTRSSCSRSRSQIVP